MMATWIRRIGKILGIKHPTIPVTTLFVMDIMEVDSRVIIVGSLQIIKRQ